MLETSHSVNESIDLKEDASSAVDPLLTLVSNPSGPPRDTAALTPVSRFDIPGSSPTVILSAPDTTELTVPTEDAISTDYLS
ncbi:hypothetical protein GJ744_010493 [Endocarpon pusillum]|uniref:Uncharacterized protein n=1 Tax=Endocarpon pusillum TaxID=364733 RepID=A0A8H7AG31_9EURO|nr:hypothetical protein GJ744_010493 [Endocarpon pusillum]